ncbi:MAG: DEAD/DEAH box helicase [Solirubrobacterales bacterium]
MGLPVTIVDTVRGLGCVQPTPFQASAVPLLRDKHDLLGQTPNDPANVAAYALPIIESILSDGPSYGPTALILVPSRELAIQVHEDVFQLSARGTAARVLGLFEGKPLTSQIGPLKHGVDIVIGTPGRVMEHVKRKTLRIEQLKILVFDRADEILNTGASRDVASILDETPKTRQTVLFSATTPPRILNLAHKHLRDPELVGITATDFESVEPQEAPSTSVVNIYFGAGKGGGVTPRDLVGVITNEGGLEGEQIGAISIRQNFSLVAVPEDCAKGLVSSLKSSLVRGRKVKIRLERF